MHVCVCPSSGPSDICLFLPYLHPKHTETPGFVPRHSVGPHLVSCVDLPVADTLSEPGITKQESQSWKIP